MLCARKTIYVIVAGLAACSTENEDSRYTKASDANAQKSADGSVVLKGQKSVTSSVVGGQSSPLNFSVAELSVHQGGNSSVEVQVQGRTPNGALVVSPPSVTGLKVEVLNSAGSLLSGDVPLDAQGSAKFKLRLTSEHNTTAGKIVASGPMSASLQLKVSDAGKQLEASLPVKVTNVAIFVMANVNTVEQLPARFEVPAGTIPIFFNPPDKQLVNVMHFEGGGNAQAQFKHQASAQRPQMKQNMGYCPLNTETTTLVTLGETVSRNCLPCPADATDDLPPGSFYDHEKGRPDTTVTPLRQIVCLKRK